MDQIENFVYQRLLWHAKAATDLQIKCEPAMDVLTGIRTACATMCVSTSGANWAGVKNAEYLVGLSASFLRTQLTIVDLAKQSEVQDGATLVRKNLETVARILELEKATDPTTLFQRPPNVGALRGNAKRLYGAYSEIAHSAHPRTSQLLGGAEDGRVGLVSLHPKYTEHTLVLITNAFAVFGEFYVWADATFPKIVSQYPKGEIDQVMAIAMQAYQDTAAHLDALRAPQQE